MKKVLNVVKRVLTEVGRSEMMKWGTIWKIKPDRPSKIIVILRL